jgi:hypothetical protein
MKVLKVLILLSLVKISYGQTYKTFVKNFNVEAYSEIICDLPGDLKIETWDKPNCQIILGIKLKTEKESILNHLVKQNRYDIWINSDAIETKITLPNIKNIIIINGKNMEEYFISIIKVPKNVYISKKKEILYQ